MIATEIVLLLLSSSSSSSSSSRPLHSPLFQSSTQSSYDRALSTETKVYEEKDIWDNDVKDIWDDDVKDLWDNDVPQMSPLDVPWINSPLC